MSKTTKSKKLPDGRELTWDEQDMGNLHAVMNGRIDGALIKDEELKKLIS